MATTKFRLRSKTDNSQIYIRFSISRNQIFEAKTGLTISPLNWSNDKGLPKQTKPELKNLAADLKDLSNFISKEYNADFSNGIVFTTEWLKKKIDAFFDRQEATEENDNFISVYLKYFLEFRQMDSAIKPATNQKFKQLQTKLDLFEKKKKTKFLISDFDRKLILEFKKFMIDNCSSMESTANTRLANLKTVLLDARDNGKQIHHQANHIKINSTSSFKVFLDFKELDKIKKLKVIGDDLTRAKDWLIIGCFTGQRVSDLLRMRKEMIYTKTDSKGIEDQYIELTQEKTGRMVTIPLHDEVTAILEKNGGDFPTLWSGNMESNSVLMNRHIKTVCERAGITNQVKGKVFDEVSKRNIIQDTEKCNLITTHVCRRSFATNFYGDKRFTTPQIMAITGHKTESVFLSYIGKTSADHAIETAKTFREIAEQKIS